MPLLLLLLLFLFLFLITIGSKGGSNHLFLPPALVLPLLVMVNKRVA